MRLKSLSVLITRFSWTILKFLDYKQRVYSAYLSLLLFHYITNSSGKVNYFFFHFTISLRFIILPTYKFLHIIFNFLCFSLMHLGRFLFIFSQYMLHYLNSQASNLLLHTFLTRHVSSIYLTPQTLYLFTSIHMYAEFYKRHEGLKWMDCGIMVCYLPLFQCVVLGLSFTVREERSRNLQNYEREIFCLFLFWGLVHRQSCLGTQVTISGTEFNRMSFSSTRIPEQILDPK